MTLGDAATKHQISRPRVVVLLSCAAVGALGLAVLFTFDPARAGFFPPCPLHALTGLYCPGCGSTRALHHLSHGRLATAFGYNPLVPLMLPYLIVAGGAQALRWAGIVRAKPGRRAPGWSILALFGMILLFGVLRNIPAAPFSHLAPGP